MSIAAKLPADIVPPGQAAEIDWSQIITEDDEPVDNILSTYQMRCWHETLRDNWRPGRKFMCNANVGVFAVHSQPPIVPDFFLSMDVEAPANVELDKKDKSNRSYFVWIYGKPPDLCIELVSNREGGELGHKMRDYALMGVPFYVVYDPLHYLQQAEVASYELVGGAYQLMAKSKYPGLGLQLMLWQGEFEKCHRNWLRWGDLDGQLIPLSKELAEAERNRAEAERSRAEALAARLRELGEEI